jgi:uncharacterized protein YndB with AHSA1/START domain
MPRLTSRTLARHRSDQDRPGQAIPPVIRDLDVPVPVGRVWAALTEAATIKAWLTCQNVTFEARVGGRYSLFDGDATGQITAVEPPRRLEYTWVMAGWPEGAPPSRVRWTLTPTGARKGTRLRLVHEAFPDRSTRDAHDAGWDGSFFDKLLPWLKR